MTWPFSKKVSPFMTTYDELADRVRELQYENLELRAQVKSLLDAHKVLGANAIITQCSPISVEFVDPDSSSSYEIHENRLALTFGRAREMTVRMTLRRLDA